MTTTATNRAFDTAVLVSAIERRDHTTITAPYAADATISIVDRNRVVCVTVAVVEDGLIARQTIARSSHQLRL